MRKNIRLADQEGELIALLFKRQAELNSLLELSRLIHSNAPLEDLLEMLRVILEVHLQIPAFEFFYKKGKSFARLYGFGIHQHSEIAIEHDLQFAHLICKVSELELTESARFQEYDYYVPIIQNNYLQAFAVLNHGGVKPAVIQHDLNFLHTLLSQIVGVLAHQQLQQHKVERERLENEIQLGREVQQMLIPQLAMHDEHLSIAASYQPHDQLGGDYFDFLKLNQDELMWCIADVSGKGIPAALLMANLQASLRACFSMTQNPKQVIRQLNELIWMNTRGERYVTLFLGVYHTKRKRLYYVNAGHQPALLFRKNEHQILKRGTVMLGAFDELPFIEMGEEELASDDLIFSYTDGLTERNSPDELLNEHQLADLLRPQLHLPLQELHQGLLNQISGNDQQKHLSDDLTLLSVRIK